MSEKKVELLNSEELAASKKDEKLEELIKIISDEKLMLILKIVFFANGVTSEILRTRLTISKKHYYSKLSSLITTGLVKRQNGKYFITAFGAVVYHAHQIFECSVESYWDLTQPIRSN